MLQRSPKIGDERLGKAIRARRVLMKMSQGHLAEKLGLSFQQVQKYEKGQNRVSSGRLVEIAGYLETSVDNLLGTDARTGRPGLVDLQLQEFLSTHEGPAIIAAFASLDPALRRTVVALAEDLARKVAS